MRIESLTIFRFIAAMIVVNFHFGQELVQWPKILIAGSEMVAFFFVLSGFVMGYSYLQKPSFSPKNYWLARFKRIAPAYFVALLVSVIVFENITFLSVVLGALFLQSWVPPYALSLNVPAWSVSVEFFFYLAFPAIAYGIRRFQLTVRQVCMGACAFWLVSEAILFLILGSNLDVNPPSAIYYFVNFSPLTYLSGFCLGVAGGQWFISHSTRNSWASTAFAVLMVAVICYVVSIEAEIQSALGLHRLEANTLSPFFLLFIIFLAKGKTRVNQLLCAGPLKRLGNASYAIYIFQLPVWIACRSIFPTIAEQPVTFMLFYLVVLIWGSLLFSKYVDSYFSQPKKTLLKSKERHDLLNRA